MDRTDLGLIQCLLHKLMFHSLVYVTYENFYNNKCNVTLLENTTKTGGTHDRRRKTDKLTDHDLFICLEIIYETKKESYRDTIIL